MHIAGMSPRGASILIGAIYVILIVGGLFAGGYVRPQLIVPGDAGATALNILENQFLYRLGFVVSLFYLTGAFVLVWVFYHLFRPVHDALASLALVFGVVATIIEAMNLVNHYAPLRILGSSSFGAFEVAQVEALALVYPTIFAGGLGISLTFFGIFCVLTGYLMFRSGLIPPVLGVLYALAGLAYLINSLTGFLVPSAAGVLFPYILAPALVAPFALASWFLFRGVDAGAWEALSAPRPAAER